MAQNGDLKAHQQTYSGFTALLKWGTAATAVVAIIVVFLIAG
ncbi:MAG TPA: aa3-type cytochrome c oxidase subunit IV [Sphingomonas sp.]|nr:aa3-type cytochrome c oxidase subunit IV [Sphingomonas sp.]